jgi:hypothetical protein
MQAIYCIPGYYWAYPLRTLFVPEKGTEKRQKTVLELENSRTVCNNNNLRVQTEISSTDMPFPFTAYL